MAGAATGATAFIRRPFIWPRLASIRTEEGAHKGRPYGRFYVLTSIRNAELRALGERTGPKRVGRLLNEAGIRDASRRSRFFPLPEPSQPKNSHLYMEEPLDPET